MTLGLPRSASFSLFGLLVLSFLSLARAWSFDYADALSKSLLYFEAQRSGRLPYNQRVSWRHHSALTDGLEQGMDLVGGYYDAGDNVKFGLPMAFTVTMLAWGAVEYGEDLAAKGQLEHALAAIKWGTDYFLKAHARADELWAQVGDAHADHYCWQRPEDMTTSRRAYRLGPGKPGSDLAGETAAAMAAASLVFRRSRPAYSTLLVRRAEQLFRFADEQRGCYHVSIPAAAPFYPSTGYADELLWAAAWLYRAANSTVYLSYLLRHAVAFGATSWAVAEFSWDLKFAGVQVLASTMLREKTAAMEKDDAKVVSMMDSMAVHYLCACMGLNGAGKNVKRTRGGMMFVRPWNNMQYVASAAFLLAVYGDSLDRDGAELKCPHGTSSAAALLAEAKAAADYILGGNPKGMSYMVGFGPRYPVQVHHRAASIAAYRESKGFVGCTQGYDEWYGQARDNPNVLVGALVGGPDEEDEFHDERRNYKQGEPCTYNTAPLVGVFARLLRPARAGLTTV
ncbi:glycosyl hydrolase 9B8 [Wolffia australiana]